MSLILLTLFCLLVSFCYKVLGFALHEQDVRFITSNYYLHYHMYGVPQGSIIGPTLFLCYINKMSNVTNCRVASYADNTIDLVYTID